MQETDGDYRFRLPLMSDLKPIWDFRLSGSILGGDIGEPLRRDAGDRCRAPL